MNHRQSPQKKLPVSLPVKIEKPGPDNKRSVAQPAEKRGVKLFPAYSASLVPGFDHEPDQQMGHHPFLPRVEEFHAKRCRLADGQSLQTTPGKRLLTQRRTRHRSDLRRQRFTSTWAMFS